MLNQEFNNGVARIVARAWLDEQFKEQLLSDPKGCLESCGLRLEEDCEIRVDQSSDAEWGIEQATTGNLLYTLPLPPKPSSLEDNILDHILERFCCNC